MGGRPTCVCSVGRQRAFDTGSTAAIDRHCLNCQNARAARLSLTSYSTLWRKVGPLAFLRTDYGLSCEVLADTVAILDRSLTGCYKNTGILEVSMRRVIVQGMLTLMITSFCLRAQTSAGQVVVTV